jgi:DHA1 family inner membrane transport protein
MPAETAPGSQPAGAARGGSRGATDAPDAHVAVALQPEDGLSGGRRSLTLATVCLAPFVTQLATFAFSPFLPFVAADLGASVSLVGQIPALALFTAAALGLVVGPLADRLGHRQTLLAGVVASSVGAVLTAAAPSLLVLVPVALVGAGGRSIGLPVAQAFVGTHYAGAQMRRGIGVIQATGTLAPIIGIPLVTAIGAVAGWRAAFLALGLLGFAAAGLMRWFLPPDRPEARTGTRLTLRAFAPVLADRPLRWLYASTLTRNLGVWALTTYLGAYLVQAHQLSAAEVGWVFTATGLGNLLGSMATAGPLGRVPLPTLAILSPVVIAVCLGVVAIVPLGIIPVVALLLLGFVGNGVAIVSQNTMLVSRGAAGRATTTSLNQTCMSLGGAIGGSLGGLLLATGGFPALGVLTLGCVLVSAACLLPVRGLHAG